MYASGTQSNAIIQTTCDTHKVNIASNAASGLANHIVNKNPGLGKTMTKLHTNLENISQSSSRKDVLVAVQKENTRSKIMPVTFTGKIRWDEKHEDSKVASVNQLDLETVWGRM